MRLIGPNEAIIKTNNKITKYWWFCQSVGLPPWLLLVYSMVSPSPLVTLLIRKVYNVSLFFLVSLVFPNFSASFHIFPFFPVFPNFLDEWKRVNRLSTRIAQTQRLIKVIENHSKEANHESRESRHLSRPIMKTFISRPLIKTKNKTFGIGKDEKMDG